MPLANDVLNALKLTESITGKKVKNEDDEMPIDYEQAGEEQPENPEQGSSDAGLEALEKVMSDALTELGLSSCEASSEDNGDLYCDCTFEDGTKLSFQFYVESGTAKVAVLTADNMENPPEEELPDSLVVDGKIDVSQVSSIPADIIKNLASSLITVSNTTEGYRRFKNSNENLAVKVPKRRLTIKLKNENFKLKNKIKSLKK